MQEIILSPLGKLGLIVLFFVVAWLVHRSTDFLTKRILAVANLSNGTRQWSAERIKTLQGLLTSASSFFAFTVAALFSLSLFVATDSLIWMIGLFSAAFGLGARPLISDYLTGIGFIFEDTIGVDEKVELQVPGDSVEGIVEAVNLRVTLLRASGGELYTVPNGEIRVIRNFSRGRYSTIKVRLKVAGSDLEQAISVLEDTGSDAMNLLPNLLEPWDVLGVGDDMGPRTGLTLVAKAKFGQGAKMRPRLLALVQKRLGEAKIELVD